MRIRQLGKAEYAPVFADMVQFTENRHSESADELWIVEHPPVYTQGKAGKPEHMLNPSDIPIVQTDRGGQITYHGPGQVVVYTLIDFARRKISVRELVSRIENAIIATLKDYGIQSANDPKRPGVYCQEKKIASIGLRIKNNAVYHGLALNVNMDLTPFNHINPCGYQGLHMTQIADFLKPCPTWAEVAEKLSKHLIHTLN